MKGDRYCPLVQGRIWNKKVTIWKLFPGIWLLNGGIRLRSGMRWDFNHG